MKTQGSKVVATKTKKAASAGTATTKPRKPRADAGKKHAPGAGKPVGAVSRKIDPAVSARMARVASFVNDNSALLKASGLAGLAGVSPGDLSRMCRADYALTDANVSAVEAASLALVKRLATALGYSVTRK